ncbi:TrmB family transcriptional regulator [Methanoregula sp.]|uniref:TrmB family transcriptional regulator n=1 Tax=Methanoregula sp. TaxID=2052170 RepID=UPI003561800F
MEQIPASLVKSLNELGLSNYEAIVYAALVLYDNAEAKEIIEYLAISKPSVYEALDTLAGMGLAVKRVSKPARYSAVSPEMAIDLLLGKHKKAAAAALETLKKLEREKVQSEKEDALWTIYGDTNIEYKIRDLFRKAKRQISCMVGERYLPSIENAKIREIPMRLLVVSDDPALQGKLETIFPGKNADIQVISREIFSKPPPFAPPDFAEMAKFMNCDNALELIIDDEELLMIPPFVSSGISVLNTRNKGAILHMKMFSQLNWRRFAEGEEMPFTMPAGLQKPRKLKK